jgi:hypothetical protein
MALIVIVALGFRQFVQPTIVKAIYGGRYGELVFQCDNVMKEHLIAKNRMLTQPSDDAVRALNAAEVGLIECDEYDSMRKRLISYGLTDNDLSQLGLAVIEQREADVKAVVQQSLHH